MFDIEKGRGGYPGSRSVQHADIRMSHCSAEAQFEASRAEGECRDYCFSSLASFASWPGVLGRMVFTSLGGNFASA